MAPEPSDAERASLPDATRAYLEALEDRATAPLEADIVRVSREYAECCADCERLRTTEGYPCKAWSAAWDRRMALQSEWMRLAKRLTPRNTEPPELRGT